MKNNIQTRLIATFIGLAIAPLLLIGIILGLQSYLAQQQQAITLQREVARRVSIEVTAFLHTVVNELQLLLNVHELSNLPLTEQEQLLNELILFDNIFDELVLLDETGQEQLRVSRLHPTIVKDLANRATADEFLIPQATGEIYYSPLHFNTETHEPQLTISVPLLDLQTRLLSGVLVAEVRFKKVWDLIVNIDFDVEGQVYIVDEAGKVVAHGNPSMVLTDTWFSPPTQNGIQTGLDNDLVILAVDTIVMGEQVFTVVVEQTVSNALALARNTVIITIVLLLITSVIASLLGIFVVRKIIRPITDLAQIAQAMSLGDLSQRATITGDDEIGQLGISFNEMALQINTLVEELEDRILERTKLLQTSTEVSRQIITILELSELLQFVVNRLQTEFNFYHVHIYLVDEETNELIMMEGSGTVGQILKKNGHRLKAGQGIVGLVVNQGHYVLSDNVNQTPNFFRNPLLPDTQSELAVPLRKGNIILGVLDVQSDEPNRFSAEDIALMQSVADQTAIAVDNAHLLEERQATILQLKEVDRAKSQFITMMSHELRTPLNAINGFAELLLLGLSGDLPEQAKNDVQLIHDNGQHLTDLIQDIIDISQIESGQIQITPQPIAPHPIINEVMEASTSLIKTKPIKLLVDLSDTLPPIQADQLRLKQILLNLVSNAIKFTADGQITITAVTDNNKFCRFSIIDTGIGIPPDKKIKIFEKFQQADMSDSRQYGGSGLGLSICQELVRLHGGQIGVDSEEGIGSTFWFTIPLSNIHGNVSPPQLYDGVA